MSPYAPMSSQQSSEVERAILRELGKSTRQMADLLEALQEYGSAAVKTAVWRLIDRGAVSLQPNRGLRRAA